MEVVLDSMLEEAAKEGGSDLHILPDNPPIVRMYGKLKRLKGYGVLTGALIEHMLNNVLTEIQQKKLHENKEELDFSYHVKGVGRFRACVFLERESLGAVFRYIPDRPLDLEGLGVPLKMKEFANYRQGLIIVTGPSGSGKTTTLASVIEYINNSRNAHIITVEEPIEYIFKNKNSIIRQREVGIHTQSFYHALHSTLRQDPDIIVVGEMRDQATIRAVLEASETGHMVFSTLHTNNASDTITRVIDVFPADEQNQVRYQLSSVLVGVFAQLLIPKRGGKGLVLASEVLVVTTALRKLIRSGQIHQIRNFLDTGEEHGMISMEQSLKNLYETNKITLDDALANATDIKIMRDLLGLQSED